MVTPVFSSNVAWAGEIYWVLLGGGKIGTGSAHSRDGTSEYWPLIGGDRSRELNTGL